MVMDSTTVTSDATTAAMNNRRMLLEQLAATRSLMHGDGEEKDDASHDIIREAMMCRKEQMMANLSTEFLLTVLLDILLLRLLNDEKGEGEGETTTVPPMIPQSNQQQQLMDDAAAKKKMRAAAKRKRRKRNKAAAKHKKSKFMSWIGGGLISLIMMIAFSSITTPIFTLSLIHASDGSGDANAPALPPSASTSLRQQRDHRSKNAASASSPPDISRRMKSDELRATACFDTPNWVDKEGDGCDVYEEEDEAGCPNTDHYEGEMGPATENCCHCGGGSHTSSPTYSPTISNSPTKSATPSGSPTISANPTQFCVNTPNWVDKSGNGCGVYEDLVERGCPGTDGNAGEMGPATENCCHCGKEPCLDTPNWNDGVHGCDWYQENDAQGCPKYGELFGEKVMGFAKDHCCYCKRKVVALVTPSPPPSISVSPSLSSSPTSSTCIDTKGWFDFDGYDCSWYEVMDEPLCPRYGNRPSNDESQVQGTANDHCCHCKNAAVSTASSPTEAPSSSTTSTSTACVDTPNWVDCGGDGCNVYEEEDPPGCPDTDHWAGDMGPASKNCCYCKNPTCEDFTSRCQADTIVMTTFKESRLAPVCEEAASSCCGVAENVKIVTNVERNQSDTVGLYDDCMCDFWLRLCEDMQGGKACDFASEHCCGDYFMQEELDNMDFVFMATSSSTCYCDIFNYAQNEFGHKLKSQALRVNEEFPDPCGQLEVYLRFVPTDNRREFYERPSLEAIYNHTNGQNWTNSAGWIDDTIDHCQWHGITCDDDGLVTNIDLRDNNLAGKFPVYSRKEADGRAWLESHWPMTKYGLANLWNLKMINLANNKLTGTIEYRPLYNLYSLTHFDVSGNKLDGKVEALVTPSLTYVDFSNNRFTTMHRFEKYKGSFQTLRFCDVSNNRIQMDATELLEYIPPNIEQLIASSNRMYGHLPGSLNNLPKLRQFDMSSNALSGSLPGFTESFATLQELDLANQKDGSHFSGSIPENIWRSLSLQRFNLAGNMIVGSIPSLIGNLALLEVFDLSNNTLTGSIPSEFGMLQGSLKQLLLANNEFVGSIPSQLGQLQGASVLLKNNEFNDSSPAPLSLCTLRSGVEEFDLVNDTQLCPIQRNALSDFYDSVKGSEWTESTNWLDEYESYCVWFGVICNDGMNNVIELNLRNNGLSGRMSESIGKLTSIEKLDLSDNDIKGSIPNEIGLLSNLTYLRLSYNAFTGTAPEGLAELTKLQLLQLQSNRITEIPVITQLDDSVYSKSTFVADCGVPSAFDEAMECDSCTMCCNANEDCYPQENTRVQERGFYYGTFAAVLFAGFVALCGAVVFSVYLFSKHKQRGSAVTRSTERSREEDEKYALSRIGKDSVYSYFVTDKKRGWLVAFVALGIQVWLLVFFVIASEANLQDDKTDIQFTWKCPRDSDVCDNKADLTSAGWVCFVLLMSAHLSKDMINGFQLIYHSSKVRHSAGSRIRYFSSGVCLCCITLFALYAATVYNKAIAMSNTDIIINSVEILFVMELDEWIFAGLEAWDENWAAHTAESESSSGKEAEKGDEVAEMKDEISLQKAQIARQNDEIAMLREAVQIMKESFGAATSSPKSTPQCDAVKDSSSHSVEPEDSDCSDTGVGKTMDTMYVDVLSTDCDTDGGTTKEQDDGTLQRGEREKLES